MPMKLIKPITIFHLLTAAVLLAGALFYTAAPAQATECVSADMLTKVQRYHNISWKQAQKDRWAKVLQAFGQEMGVTAMTSDEAQAYHDRGPVWKWKWAGIPGAIKCLEDIIADAQSSMQNNQFSVNHSPQLITAFPHTVSLDVGESWTADLSTHFSDQDGDQISYSAKLGQGGGTGISVSVSGTTLTVTANSPDSASVLVTASDGEVSIEVKIEFLVSRPATVISECDSSSLSVSSKAIYTTSYANKVSFSDTTCGDNGNQVNLICAVAAPGSSTSDIPSSLISGITYAWSAGNGETFSKSSIGEMSCADIPSSGKIPNLTLTLPSQTSATHVLFYLAYTGDRTKRTYDRAISLKAVEVKNPPSQAGQADIVIRGLRDPDSDDPPTYQSAECRNPIGTLPVNGRCGGSDGGFIYYEREGLTRGLRYPVTVSAPDGFKICYDIVDPDDGETAKTPLSQNCSDNNIAIWNIRIPGWNAPSGTEWNDDQDKLRIYLVDGEKNRITTASKDFWLSNSGSVGRGLQASGRCGQFQEEARQNILYYNTTARDVNKRVLWANTLAWLRGATVPYSVSDWPKSSKEVGKKLADWYDPDTKPWSDYRTRRTLKSIFDDGCIDHVEPSGGWPSS